MKEPGKGRSRRVTPDNLEQFRRILATPETRAQRNGSRSANTDPESNAPVDPEIERLFPGTPFPLQRPGAPQQGTRRRASVASENSNDSTISALISRQVLFAEIPRSSTRVSQANFDKNTFFNYLFAEGRTSIRLWEVTDRGIAPNPEIRPAGRRKSVNFNVELSALAGVTYPNSGRPIAIFTPISEGDFLYAVLLPGMNGYESADAVLAAHNQSPPNQVRRAVIDHAIAVAGYPKSPLWEAERVMAGR